LLARAGADGVIVASALVDALGPRGDDVDALGRLVTSLRAAGASAGAAGAPSAAGRGAHVVAGRPALGAPSAQP
ncbi:MAG TPA: hypothetical protein VF802_08390, partial [Candidatus Limnocylindrales bacterium]